MITGSVRAGRFAPVVTNWFAGQAGRRGDLTIDVIDLADTAAENPAGSPRGFASRIGTADAVIVVVPEYNHGYPGPLKTAIDSVNREWHAKPIGFVCYGGRSGGLRAVEQLRLVFAELHTVTVRETVSFHLAHGQFDDAGTPHDAVAANAAAKTLLDQLIWWARALRTARAASPYGA